LSNKTIPWYEAYTALAMSLAKLKDVQKNNSGAFLYERLSQNSEFVDSNKWFNKFNELRVIDPLHIFSSVSANLQSDKYRTKKLDAYYQIITSALPQSQVVLFRLGHEYSNIDFRGCPSPPAIQSLSLRDSPKQLEIWDAFESIYHQNQRCDLESIFSKSKNWYGISHRLLTMFLFWINPNDFLPLDRNTVTFLENNLKDFKEPKTGENYRKLLKYKNSTVYRDIALISYDPDSSELLKDRGMYEKYFNKNSSDISTKKHNFKLLAIKPLNGCNPSNLKSLKEDVIYKLDKGFQIHNNGTVEYKEVYKLFSLNSMSVNFSAIVGKNGTGKSTLVELFIACFNNIAFKVFSDKKDIKLSFIESLCAEIYFYTDRLYKITLAKESIDFVSFVETETGSFNASEKIGVNELEFHSLFYSVLVNYSLHGLNQKSCQGDWLNNLFHKNDGYQTPVVIEPFRKNGNIDINRQDELAKARLMHNLLTPIGIDDSFKVLKRCKNRDYLAHSFKLNNNSEKLKDVKREYKRKDSPTKENSHYIQISDIEVGDLIEQLFKEFECAENLNDLNDNVREYLIRKLLSISVNYEKYFDFFNLKEGDYKFLYIETFVKEIRQDTSHMVTKLRRVINHYKFGLYPSTKANYIISDVSKNIEYILAKSATDELEIRLPKEKLDFLLPPSFFNVDIYLEDETEFSSLSSGEKQIIFSLNSLTYHLRNLDSVLSEPKRAKYKFVNIFLDEIELCFHPELQRIYLNELYKTLIRFNEDSANIIGINICFITHSPFVLSDIPDNNVLFLSHDDANNLLSVPLESTIPTFAANIHDLLNDGFFVSSTIGAFAEMCLKDILNFKLDVQKAELSDQDKRKQLIQDFNKKIDRFRYVISCLGDTYIKPLMENNLKTIIDTLGLTQNEQGSVQNEIEALERRLRELRSKEDA